VRTTCCIAGEGGIENDETTPMKFPNDAGKTAAAATRLLVVMATNDDFIVWSPSSLSAGEGDKLVVV
jgi:hypothetical protein